jgi:prepilin-type N-terminal cleavage/methylation domain-containing protein
MKIMKNKNNKKACPYRHAKHGRRGFTLLEILLVIALLATLAVIVIVALNPMKRFEDARNSRRLSDIQSILSAVQQYMVDNKGAIPAGIFSYERQIGTSGGGCELSTTYCSESVSDCIDLSSQEFALGNYLKTIPYDPKYGSSTTTHYTISVDSNNIFTVKACDSTDVNIYSVSR